MSFGIPVRNGLAIGLLSSTTLSSRRGLSPAMYLNFLQPFLDSRITFSRGSNATLVDSTGKITYAPANLMLTSSFATLAGSAGSQYPSGTGWSNFFNTGGTRTYVASSSFDGSQAMDIAGVSAARNLIGFSFAAASNTTYVVSFYIESVSGVTGIVAYATGTLGTGGTTNNVTAPTTTGRYSYTFTTGASAGTVDLRFGIGCAANESGSIRISNTQLEPVTYQTTPSTYVATTSAAYYGPRFDYDPVTLAPKGLLIEEARTNLVTYSEQFGSWTNSGATVTANSIAAPSGETTADTIVRVGFTSDAIYNTATFTGDGVKAVSLWIKKGTSPSTLIALLDATASVYRLWADVTWSGTTPSLAFTNGSLISSTNYGNGWWRLELATTAVTAANSNRIYVYPGRTGSVNGDTVYCWGAQAENATFATSYIPTVASTVTRSADVATMTGTNFSSWYNQSEGTFVCDSDTADANTANRSIYFAANAGGTDIVYGVAGTLRTIRVLAGGATTGEASAGVFTNNVPAKTAGAYKVNDFAASFNGGTVATDTVGAVPTTVDRLTLGTNTTLTALNYLNGHIRSIAYYNTRLPNSQLQTLTAPSLGTTLSLSFTNQAYTVGV